MLISKRIIQQKGSLIREIYQKAKADSINLGLGMPYCNTPSDVKKNAIESILNNKTFYTSNYGLFELRKAIAFKYNKRHNHKISHNNVLITIGVAEAIFISIFSILDSGDEVLIPDPGYPGYYITSNMLSANIVTYPLNSLNKFSIKADDVISRISDKTKIIILNSPSNPTGGINTSGELQKIASYCEKRNICIISDEVYSNLLYSDIEVDSISNYLSLNKTFILDGVSKEFSMTGWRIGWIISSEENISELVKVHQVMSSCATSISQYAAIKAIESENKEIILLLSKNRDIMAKELKKINNISFYEPLAGLYFFIDVSKFGNDIEIAEHILDKVNVITIPGSAFGRNGNGYLRISFGANPDEVEEGTKRLNYFFEKMKG